MTLEEQEELEAEAGYDVDPPHQQRVDSRKECLVYTEKHGREFNQVHCQISQNTKCKMVDNLSARSWSRCYSPIHL